MCFSACHWAKVDRIVYGASIADAAAAGFNELPVSNQELKRIGNSPVQISGGIMTTECRELFARWLGHPGRRGY
jgi:tRNA(Arg) A34 adenosine deaminase TadA